MRKSSFCLHGFGLLALICVTGHSDGGWTVTTPTGGATFKNNQMIEPTGDKTNGETGNGWLKREVTPGNWNKVTAPNPINYANATTWTCIFYPCNFPLPGNWPLGNYRAYVQNVGQTAEAEGDTFTVVNP